MNNQIFYNKTINKKELKTIIHSTFESYGMAKATKLAEALKKSGFKFATQAGVSISIEDLKVPPTKDPLFLKNNKEIQQAYFYEKRGGINEIERFQKVIDTWHSTSDLLKNQLVDFFKTVDPLNPVYMMAFSGARGNMSQVRQLVGMRGLMADPNGQIIDLPIKANFREGLTITDYVISSYGARKGIVDTALRTADSGYLTRRLVDVAQHIIIREVDCKTKNGIRISFDPSLNKLNNYIGRVLVKSVFEKNTHKCLIKAGTILTLAILKTIKNPTDLILRSPLICESSRSICQKCYGWNLAKGELVELADAVGIIAAQSIGEPGTQLTMRTFHTGGVFTGESSNQIHAQSSGQILFSSDLQNIIERTIYGETILKVRNNTKIFLLTEEPKLIKIPVIAGMLLFVKNKSFVKKGELLAEILQQNKQTIKQRKIVKSQISGEVQFQNIRFDKSSLTYNNGLIWIASGHVYNLLPNMVIKNSGTTIVKGNALAQSRIVFPLAGFVKLSKTALSSNLSIVNNLFAIRVNSLYKKDDNSFIYFEPDLFFQLNNLDTLGIQLAGFQSFGKSIRYSYRLSLPGKVFFSSKEKNQVSSIAKFSVCIIVFHEKIISYQIETLFNENISYFDKKLVFPGEFILNSIEISQLSYCEVFISDPDSFVSIKLTPIIQCAISNPSHFALKKQTQSFDKFPVCFLTRLNLDEKNQLMPDQAFVTTYLGFKDFCNLAIYKFILKSFSLYNNFLVFLIKYEFPSNVRSLLNEERSISYLVSHNQYIDPYTTIATLNNTVIEKTVIKAIKNNRFRPLRFLIVTPTNYKAYSEFDRNKFYKKKFILIGDSLNGEVKYANYSGYKINNQNSDNMILRISLPFFISKGTYLLIKHGSFIQKGESLCQLIYTRFVSDDIVTGLPRIENLLEARNKDAKEDCKLIENPGIIKRLNENGDLTIIEKSRIQIYSINDSLSLPLRKGEIVKVAQPLQTNLLNPHKVLDIYFKYYCSFYTPDRATKYSIGNTQILLLNLVQDVYRSQGIYIADKHVEIIIRQITSKVRILTHNVDTFFVIREFLDFEQVKYLNMALKTANRSLIEYQPVLVGITKVSLLAESFVSAASFQETTRILAQAAIEGRVEWLRGLKENVILGRLIPAGTGFKSFNRTSLLNIRFNG